MMPDSSNPNLPVPSFPHEFPLLERNDSLQGEKNQSTLHIFGKTGPEYPSHPETTSYFDKVFCYCCGNKFFNKYVWGMPVKFIWGNFVVFIIFNV